MTMIEPTIGRVVWYRPSSLDHTSGMQIYPEGNQPLEAHVCFVWSPTCVNLLVIDHNGGTHRRSSVPINVEPAGGSAYAEWMPYQKGQAAKAAS